MHFSDTIEDRSSSWECSNQRKETLEAAFLTESGKSPASIARSNKQWVGTCLYQEWYKPLLISCEAAARLWASSEADCEYPLWPESGKSPAGISLIATAVLSEKSIKYLTWKASALTEKALWLVNIYRLILWHMHKNEHIKLYIKEICTKAVDV